MCRVSDIFPPGTDSRIDDLHSISTVAAVECWAACD